MFLEIILYEECGRSLIWLNMELNVWFFSGMLFYKLFNFYIKWNLFFFGDINYVMYIMIECYDLNKNFKLVYLIRII